MADDYAANTTTRGRISVGAPGDGLIETVGDRDWFAMTLTAGQAYVFSLNSLGVHDPYLSLYNASGGLLASNDDSGGNLNSRLVFTPTVSGTYYLGARDYGSGVGAYRLSAALADDYAGSVDTQGAIAPGQTLTGRIDSPGDQDWLALDLQTGQSVQVRLDSTGLADPFLTLYGGDGVAQLSDDDGGGNLNSRLDFTVTQGGRFYVGVRDYDRGIGNYAVSVALAVSDDFADDARTSAGLGVGQAVDGRIEVAGDEDWLAVSLTAGQGYVFDLTSSGLADPYLALFNAAGTLAASDDDGAGGLNARIVLQPTASGTYYLAAMDYASGTGAYRLSATTMNTDDYPETTATPGQLTVGGSLNGQIEAAGDRDAVAVSLQAGETYELRMTGAGLPDPYLSLHDAAGNALLADDDSGGGRNAMLTYTATTSGTFYVLARDYGGGTGAYQLSASRVTPQTGGGAGGAGAYAIDVRYEGEAQYRSYFDAAAQRWAQVITGDLPDVLDNQYGRIDDLLIEASVTSIDGAGNILGQASYTGLRSAGSGGLPYRGFMQFDAADLAAMVTAGTLGSVILHEMGHVLGISESMFQVRGLTSNGAFVGNQAVQQYRLMSSSTAGANSVPLENDGGPGTRGSHWEESIFNTELMTGYAESAPPMPLSALTIAALQDLGYAVNYSAADLFVL